MDFKKIFLAHYLSAGIGSFSKRDVDALVMYLLDEYGADDQIPIKVLSNQQASLKLRATASKIKSLRYEAALKFTNTSDAEVRAKWKLLEILARATFETEGERVCFIIEDNFTKNWLQGVLKENGLIFDHSFNTEITKIRIEPLCSMLSKIYDPQSASTLESRMTDAIAKNQQINFAELKRNFLEGAVTAIGEAISPAKVAALIASVI